MKIALPIVLSILAHTASMAVELDLPPRSADSPNGTQFYNLFSDTNIDFSEREQELYKQIFAGNIPESHRELKPVVISEGPNNLTIFVSPDYLSIGSDADYFHMPMTPILGQILADKLDCILPTRKMVNEIWSDTDIKLSPSPIPPSPAMTTVPVFWDHEQTLRGQFQTAGATPGQLIGGHKKDVVITPRLYQTGNDDNVAIYGWHYTNGTNIQPLYLGHADFYADYSHGIRLVSKTALLNGVETSIVEILSNPSTASLLSDEGIVSPAEYPIKFITTPFSDSFTSQGRESIRWIDRFKTPVNQAFSPTAPNGDGYTILVRDTTGGIDTTRVQPYSGSDYTVTAMIYCDYRPNLSGDGFDRVGIFVRDDGNGMFEGISGSGIRGNNYSLTWDSHTGEVQALKTVNGVNQNLLPTEKIVAESGWKEFKITAFGSSLQFVFDGEPILTIEDTTHVDGAVGIGYHEFFATNSNIIGTRVDQFSVTNADDLVTTNSWNTY